MAPDEAPVKTAISVHNTEAVKTAISVHNTDAVCEIHCDFAG
jgi:hypothetical protein